MPLVCRDDENNFNLGDLFHFKTGLDIRFFAIKYHR